MLATLIVGFIRFASIPLTFICIRHKFHVLCKYRMNDLVNSGCTVVVVESLVGTSGRGHIGIPKVDIYVNTFSAMRKKLNTHAPRLTFTVGEVPPPQARKAPVLLLVTLEALQLSPSPLNDQVPHVFGVVVNVVRRYVALLVVAGRTVR